MTEQQEKIRRWLVSELAWENAEFAGPLSGGNSNLTWRFNGTPGDCVVRTIPMESISPSSARGIERESTVLKLVEGKVKAPKLLAWCSDIDVIGRPFSVQEYVKGVSVTDQLPSAYAHCANSVNALGTDMISPLADIHAIPADTPGVSALGRPEHFIQRQIERWLKVRHQDVARPLPTLFSLGEWLLANIPALERATLIHGDYHLDNTLSDVEEPRINAIIDWELATIGSPHMDLGLALLFWGDYRTVSPPGFAHLQSISRHSDALSRHDLAKQWSQLTGLSLEHMDYYMALAAWRLAAIVEGAFCLYKAGKVDSAYAAGLEHDVPALLGEALQASQGHW